MKKGRVPHGHATFNAGRNFEKGEVYIHQINELNHLEVLIAELMYKVRIYFMENERVIMKRCYIF